LPNGSTTRVRSSRTELWWVTMCSRTSSSANAPTITMPATEPAAIIHPSAPQWTGEQRTQTASSRAIFGASFRGLGEDEDVSAESSGGPAGFSSVQSGGVAGDSARATWGRQNEKAMQALQAIAVMRRRLAIGGSITPRSMTKIHERYRKHSRDRDRALAAAVVCAAALHAAVLPAAVARADVESGGDPPRRPQAHAEAAGAPGPPGGRGT